MNLKSLEGLADAAKVAVNAKDLRGVGIEVAPDCPAYRPVKVSVGKLRAAINAKTAPKSNKPKDPK